MLSRMRKTTPILLSVCLVSSWTIWQISSNLAQDTVPPQKTTPQQAAPQQAVPQQDAPETAVPQKASSRKIAEPDLPDATSEPTTNFESNSTTTDVAEKKIKTVRRTVPGPGVVLSIELPEGSPKQTTGIFLAPSDYLIASLPGVTKIGQVKVTVKGLFEPGRGEKVPMEAQILNIDQDTSLALLKVNLACVRFHPWATTADAEESQLVILDPATNQIQTRFVMRRQPDPLTVTVNGHDLAELVAWYRRDGHQTPPDGNLLLDEEQRGIGILVATSEQSFRCAVSADRILKLCDLWSTERQNAHLGRPMTEDELKVRRQLPLPIGQCVLEQQLANGEYHHVVASLIDDRGHFIVPQRALPKTSGVTTTIVYLGGRGFPAAQNAVDRQTGIALWGITATFPEEPSYLTFRDDDQRPIGAGESLKFANAVNGIVPPVVEVMTRELERIHESLDANPILRLDQPVIPGAVATEPGKVRAMVIGTDDSPTGGVIAYEAATVADALDRIRETPEGHMIKRQRNPRQSLTTTVVISSQDWQRVLNQDEYRKGRHSIEIVGKDKGLLSIRATPEDAQLIEQLRGQSSTVTPPQANEEDAFVQELIAQYPQASNEKKQKIQEELLLRTTRQFERRMQQRQEELQSLESRLEKLKQDLTQRDASKPDIIRRRVESLLGIANLDWELPSIPNSPEQEFRLSTGAKGQRIPLPQTVTPSSQPDFGVPSYDQPATGTQPFAPPTKPVPQMRPGTGKGQPRSQSSDAFDQTPQQQGADPFLGTPPSGPPRLFPQNIPNKTGPTSADVVGSVDWVARNGMTKISIGSDLGLKLEQVVEVYRYRYSQNSYGPDVENRPLDYVGSLEVDALQADQSVCKPVPGSRVDFLRARDVVVLKRFNEKTPLTLNPNLAALQGVWVLQAGEQADHQESSDTKSEPIIRWIIDGKLFYGETQTGEPRFQGMLSLGETKSTKFIEIRDFEDMSLLEPPAGASRSTFFLYQLEGDQLKTQGFNVFFSPANLPASFGGSDASGVAYIPQIYQRERVPPMPMKER